MHGTSRLSLVLACLACVSCGPAAFEPRVATTSEIVAGESSQLLEGARQQFARGNVALALQGFRRIMRQESGNLDAYVGIAACYDRMGRFELSRRYYEEALALAPGNPVVRHNFAVSLRMQGREEDARRLESEVAAAPPDPAQAPAPQASVTIALPPVEPGAVADRPVKDGARLVRLSFAEVVLLTLSGSGPERIRTAASNSGNGVTVALAPAESPGVSVDAGKLRILNAVGRRGMASRMQSYLDAQGVRGASIGDAEVRPVRSLIVYPKGAQTRASALAARLPFKPALRERARGDRVILLRGRDALAFDNGLARRERAP